MSDSGLPTDAPTAGPRVWQIACGRLGRFYDQLFLDHDVMFMGPGKHGQFQQRVYDSLVERGAITRHKANQVRSFYLGVQPGDVVLLRKGYRVISAGRAVGHNYHWNESLDDVHGWDLQHCRCVAWQRDVESELDDIQSKGPLFSGRIEIPTFTAVTDRKVLDPLTHLFPRLSTRPIVAPPKAPAPLTLEELGQRLFSKGLPNDAVDRVLHAIARQRRMAAWYEEQGHRSSRPKEHEIVAHMVLPLLLALGWSEQLLAVEWKKVDLAAFGDTPTTRENCVLVCEAKHAGHGLQNVWEQAVRYVQTLTLEACSRILLTEGGRFYLFARSSVGWDQSPMGYLNVAKVREDHVVPRGTNAVNTISALTPMNVLRAVI